MKTIKTLSLMALFFFSSSCSLTVDFDDEDSIGQISVSVEGSNTDGSVSNGGYLDLEIMAADGDGIDSILIAIPALNVNFSTNVETRLPNQKITQNFKVVEIDSGESPYIYVTLTDRHGNSYTKTVAFVIK